jgi:catechol 2,3-dioxygenase-like lactoylglutathione lyase family enzyme
MNDVLAGLAPNLFQVAYVVRDVEAAEQWFQRILGVPSFFRMENVEVGHGCSYRGQPADYASHLSLGYLGDVQIELIEPVRGQSPYTEFLAGKGPGLHHLAFLVPDFEATVAFLGEGGLELVAGGQLGPGSQFAYFDCEAEGFSVIEILGFDRAIRGFMEQIKSGALG